MGAERGGGSLADHRLKIFKGPAHLPGLLCFALSQDPLRGLPPRIDRL